MSDFRNGFIGMVVVVWITGCAGGMLPLRPAAPAGGAFGTFNFHPGTQSADALRDCIDRVNAAATHNNSARQSAHNWATVLGITTGVGTGFGLVAATPDLQPRLGSATVYVSAGIAAASAILAPFVTSTDEANRATAEYTTLLGELDQAETSPSETDEGLRLLRQCAYGHADFATPAQPVPRETSTPDGRQPLPSPPARPPA